MKQIMHRRQKHFIFLLLCSLAAAALFACSPHEDGTAPAGRDEDRKTDTADIIGTEDTAAEQEHGSGGASSSTNTSDGGTGMKYASIKVNGSNEHQVWAGFGASSCWWSQYVGGWDNRDAATGRPMYEAIAELLYSREKGLGLTIYRYNVGAGSVELDQKGNYWDPSRRAECFETAPGVYDFSKDANAVRFMKKCQEIAGDDFEAIFFCNSPLVRLTNSGHGYLNEGTKSNINPDKYDDFAKYVLDVAEHFKNEECINVTEISPINEPQWDWFGGQEGCHYEPAQLVDVLRVFLNELGSRENLTGVRLSSPESGEWGGRTQEYVNAIMKDALLGSYFDTLDCHSYWTTAATKSTFKKWVSSTYPELKLRNSEWCEMVNGDDYTMDSAFNMAEVIMDDLRILEVESWQDWVAVAPGNYRDGVIYVNRTARKYMLPKRYYGFGNFTRFIRPGYVRVDIDNTLFSNTYKLSTVAFKGTEADGHEKLVIVLINKEPDVKRFTLALEGCAEYTGYEIYSTNEEYGLECTNEGAFTSDTVLAIEGSSISTIVLTR